MPQSQSSYTLHIRGSVKMCYINWCLTIDINICLYLHIWNLYMNFDDESIYICSLLLHFICYRLDLPDGQHCRYCFYSQADFWVFRPQDQHVAPIKVKQIWKSSLGGATIGARMPEKIFKIWENGWKVCAHHFDHLEASWKKSSTTAFNHVYCRCAPV